MQDLKELNEVIAGIKDEICKGAETLTTSRSVYEFKKTFLDNKQGRIGLLMKEMRNVPNDQKAEFGKTINGAKEWANQFFDELDQKLKEKEQQQRYESEKIDITMPPKKIRYGNLHPVTTVRNQLTDIFASMGFEVYEGTEFLGLIFALVCGQAHPKFNKKVSKYLLQYSVVGLGFGMNLQASLASGKEGMEFTIISVIGTMIIGMFIGRKLLKVDRDTAYLISSGTAICGGSAIAAVGPVLKAKDSEMSVALATIFVLNAIALFIFPVLGHTFGLDQQQFGTWAAIAIHDTSSVVGAGAAYGEEALKVATTIKLTRALWIIPLAFATSFIFKGSGKKVSIPWFILYFVVAIVLNTYVLDGVPQFGQAVSGLARKGLIITMFFIGASLSMDVLKQVGMKPLIQGVALWAVISISSLAYILLF